uniref:Thiamine biosynthesis protein S n=1 Tax=Compsopogon caeruleus TaxID=31354 RepID=A0A1Z1XB17_9RHOD|nr:thiamine biosynthesis protein S [Compsopogon caeruleus]ARX96062.1 thiamine biosynthesis protein S [Compsopogon caeruleus]
MMLFNSKVEANKIVIKINGQAFSCLSDISLKNLLEYLDFDLRLIIIEYNSIIISKNKLSSIIIKEGDQIEIVTIVGGG